ncbi:MAG: ABC transporter ATP-binding protein [Nitrososphaerales archaeon]
MFDVEDLVVRRGPTPVLHGVSLTVRDREAVCLLGRNGVGKTTLLRSIMGLTPSRGGRVVLDGRQLQGKSPHVVARSGIGYVPQGRRVFARHSVEQNLLIGTRRGQDVHTLMRQVFELFPVLEERRPQAAGTLSGGEQQMVAIARCLMLEPRLVLLDEPTEGLQPSLVQDLTATLPRIQREFGTALLLVEQNLDFAFALCSRGYVLEKGVVASQGDVDALQDDAVIKEYLVV